MYRTIKYIYKYIRYYYMRLLKFYT
jgi:hypothetical protein